MIRPFKGVVPQIAPSAYVDASAQVIGDVHVGERSSIWPNCTIRGDVNSIRIGQETSIQDNSVLHGQTDQFQVVVGDRVTVGHGAVLHGCTIEEDVLVGIGAIVLNGARVGRNSVIAAGAVVSEGQQIPPYSLVMGVPGKVRRQISERESERFRSNATRYIKLTQAYREEPA